MTAQHLATLTVPVGADDVEVPIISGRLNLHGSAIPSYEGEIVLPATPETAAARAALDGRTAPRCILRAGTVQPNGDRTLSAIGVVRPIGTEWDAQAGRTVVEVASDESLVMTARVWWQADADSMPRTGVPEAVEYILGRLVPDESFAFVSEVPAGHAPAAVPQDVEAGDLWLDIIEGMTQASQVRFYCDRFGTYRLSLRTEMPTPAEAIDLTGTLTSTTRRASLDGWANCVMVQARWTDAAGDQQQITGRARVADGPMGTQLAGWRVHKIDTSRGANRAQVDARARENLQRIYRLGSGWNLEGWANYHLRPDDTVTWREAGVTVTQLIRNISFELGTGTMTLSTREDTVPTILEETAP